MYKRMEIIEEENLNWESVLVQPPVEKTDYKLKTFLNNGMNVGKKKLNIRKLTSFINENSEISLLFSVVILPYIVGFCFSYFLFYFYGGMSIGSFLGAEQNHSSIEMWSIGAYIFITGLAIWSILAL
ncbi:hypothetical protein [Sulfurovum sp.]|uniref:hypothetical protein n=1 Tax=Sulfurovum sp. TaxID=1969726 RepID=UPI002867D2F0|nr:hypothetical protein [Sulfurovum sp.]